MKRKFIMIISAILISFMCIKIADTNLIPIEDKHITSKIKEAQWERLVYALCQTESNCDDTATNPSSSAAGRFQMLRGYVDEVNRIKNKEVYKYKDRFDSTKSREMFEIYQDHHNPTKDIDRAIIIHRGKKSKLYIKKVKEIMNESNNDRMVSSK